MVKRLTESIGFINTNQAHDICTPLLEKIARNAGAHLSDIFKSKFALSHPDSPQEPYLVPIAEFDDVGRRREGPYNLLAHLDDPMLLSWAYFNKKPLWLDMLQQYREGIKKHNLVSAGEEIEPKFIRYWESTDSIIVFPLIYMDTIWGTFSLEAPERRPFKSIVFKELQQLSVYLTDLIYKVDAFDRNELGNKEAIEGFKKRIRETSGDLYDTKKGFLAYPYDNAKFEVIIDSLKDLFAERNIYLVEGTQDTTSENIIQDILEKVNQSYFGVFDVTQCTNNVMLELGMMMNTDKRVLILKQVSDESEIPFNIAHKQVHRYELLQGREFRVLPPGTKTPLSLEKVVNGFIDELLRDQRFKNAIDYDSKS